MLLKPLKPNYAASLLKDFYKFYYFYLTHFSNNWCSLFVSVRISYIVNVSLLYMYHNSGKMNKMTILRFDEFVLYIFN